MTTRKPLQRVDPYGGQFLEIDLRTVRPRQGDNLLDIALVSRPVNISSDLSVEDVEMIISYGMFPTHVDS